MDTPDAAPSSDGPSDLGAEVYRKLIEVAPDAMLLLNAEGRITLANLQMERLFGYTKRELLGQSIELLIPERVRETHARHRTRFFQAPTVRPMGLGLPLYGMKRDGTEFPVEISLSPLPTDEGLVVAASIRDGTERERFEDELRAARALAEAASNAKSEFLASMSHELRTPLNAILGFAQLLQRDRKTPLSERQLERIEYVIKGGEHLLRLIDEVLDLARVEAGSVLMSPEAVHIGHALSDVRVTLEPMAQRAEVALILEALPPALPLAWTDRTRFLQILINLGSNAIKYGKKGGVVRLGAMGLGTAVRVCVTDDGAGIPLARQSRLFQPFFRAGQEAGPIPGTGIGLAISKRLAERMGASMGFRSTEGAGSSFWIDLPLPVAIPGSHEVERGPRTDPSVLSGPGPSRLVVYIEDNPSNIAFMRDLLADFERIELLTAPTAEIGLELVRARRPRLVLMDIHLPGMNGIEAAERLRSWPETCDIPLIALSAAGTLGDRASIDRGGFFRFLTKPVQVDALIQLLEELLVPPGGEPPSTDRLPPRTPVLR
jgi:PAS domain S-box-containing protein